MIVALKNGPPNEEVLTIGIIAWIVLGAIAGFVASWLMGSREGIIGTVVLGSSARGSGMNEKPPWALDDPGVFWIV